MLKPAWYLTDGDFYLELADAPRHEPAAEALANTALTAAEELFGDEAGLDPAHTMTAMRLGLHCAIRLNDSATHAPSTHNLADLIRLTHGLNLLHAYLTQTIQQVAHQTSVHAFTDLATYPAAAVTPIVDSLSAAGAIGEIAAGHLKEAHLALRNLPT